MCIFEFLSFMFVHGLCVYAILFYFVDIFGFFDSDNDYYNTKFDCRILISEIFTYHVRIHLFC